MKAEITPRFLRDGSLLMGIIVFLIFFLNMNIANGQSLEEQAMERINTLQNSIDEAESTGIDCYKEKMTIRTAEVFLDFANWDENNIGENTEYFELVQRYKNSAAQTAQELPDFERNEVIVMLDEAIGNVNALIKKEIFREAIPQVDWTQVTRKGNQLIHRGRPVFLSDYTWKPKIQKLTEFHGNQDGVYFDQKKVENAIGKINEKLLNDVQTKSDGTMGFIFLGNKSAPDWAENKYGPGFKMRESTFTGYDIDNPGALELNTMLFRGTVPFMAGKKYTQLGYMLCNEPHFYTTKTGDKLDWASGPVSEYTKVKFRTWLENKHESIDDLNALWETSFSNFNEVSIEIPIDIALQGTPKWYDWVTFNNYRVVQWYSALKDSITKYDATAKVHLKIMPNLWTENKRGHGIDFETLTEMSGVIGNDAGTANAPMWGEPYEWQEHYDFEWRELYMAYDFLKSVSPDKMNFNSEAHFLSTGRSRDLHQKPIYARATYWAATTLGMNASQTWFWARLADGSIKSNAGKGYAGSNNQQPRIVNEVASTFMDLNSFSEEISAMQYQRKPIRIFYSETSATNKPTHMDDIFELYESLNFDGIPLGFASKNIIEKQDNKLWDVIVVYKTEFITTKELKVLQVYLDNKGVVIIDSNSLKKNEYKQGLSGLTQSNGQLIELNSLKDIKLKVNEILDEKDHLPAVTIAETNSGEKPGCSWKCVENEAGNQVLSLVNLGKTDAKLKINLKDANFGTACKDLLKGIFIHNETVLKPSEVLFIEVSDGKGITSTKTIKTSNKLDIRLYPNPARESFTLSFDKEYSNVKLFICNVSGQLVESKEFSNTSLITQHISNYSLGSYYIKVVMDNQSKSFKLLKFS